MYSIAVAMQQEKINSMRIQMQMRANWHLILFDSVLCWQQSNYIYLFNFRAKAEFSHEKFDFKTAAFKCFRKTLDFMTTIHGRWLKFMLACIVRPQVLISRMYKKNVILLHHPSICSTNIFIACNKFDDRYALV